MHHTGALLLAIGLVPVACGGVASNSDRDGGGSGGSSNAGKGPIGTAGTQSPSEGGAAGDTGAAGTGGFPTPTCTSPQYDALTGLVLCSEGYSHRPTRVACAGFGGAASDEGGAGAGHANIARPKPRARLAMPTYCNSEGQGGAGDDCSRFKLGYCEQGERAICRSGCYVDEDCGPGNVCTCGHAESPSGGVCADAGCQVDADCGPDNFCASFDDAEGRSGFACFSPLDECRSSADCGGGRCSYAWSFDEGVEHRLCD